MVRKGLLICLIVAVSLYLFVLNYNLNVLRIQMTEIGLIVQELNNRVKSLEKDKLKDTPWLHPKEDNIYVRLRLRVTAYSSEVSQTDSDPYTGAWNNPVRDGMVAVSRDLEKLGLTNKVPIIIKDREYTILDKMGKFKTVKGEKIRIEKSLDIWMKSREEAIDWGVKYVDVKVPLKHININKLIANNLNILI